MTDDTNKTGDDKMLSRPEISDSLDLTPIMKHRVNKQLRYCADPVIHRTKRKRGGTYYTYRQGDRQEIYLGTAEFILEAVTMLREVKKHGHEK